MVLTRVGTGSGIQGQWQGTVQGGIAVTMQIDATTINLTSLCMADAYADAYMVDEASSDTMLYNITVAKVSCNQITLTGNTSHEVVTISFGQVTNLDNPNADVTFTSNNARHAGGMIHANPTSCPDDPPAWFTSFLDANPKIGKRARMSATLPIKKKVRMFLINYLRLSDIIITSMVKR